MEMFAGVSIGVLFLLSIVSLFINNSKEAVAKYYVKSMVNTLCIILIISLIVIVTYLDRMNYYKTIVEENYVMVEMDGTTSYYEKKYLNEFKMEYGG